MKTLEHATAHPKKHPESLRVLEEAVMFPHHFSLEVPMSFTRWFVYASFASGVIALSLQPSGIVHAHSSPMLVADQSASSSPDGQRDSRSGKTGTTNAESSGKMQSEKDPNSRFEGKSSGPGSEVAPGSTKPGTPNSSGSSPSPRPSNGGGGPETSGGGTNAGPR